MENEKARENAKEEKISQVLSAVAEAMVKEALSDVPDSSMTVVSGNRDSTIVNICVNGNNGIFSLAADSSKWIDKLPAVVKVLCDSEKSGEEIYDALLKVDLPIAEIPESQSEKFSLTASKTGFLRLFCKGALWQITPKKVKSVELFEVSLIGDYAFSECSSLETVEIPSSVTEIADSAFYACYSLKAVEIPSGVTEIGGDAFSECHSLEAVKIPSSVTAIGKRTFKGCSSLKVVEIPSSVMAIGECAFSECHSLEAVKILSGVTAIGEFAFFACYSLKAVEIPSSVIEIGIGAFDRCRSLETVEIPSSVTEIGIGAFASCSSLSDVQFGGTVAQWEAVQKGGDWCKDVSAKSVKCADGDVSL